MYILRTVPAIRRNIAGRMRNARSKPGIRKKADGHYLKQPLTPYHSQWSSPELVEDIINGSVNAQDDPRWKESGADTPEEYEMYSWQICGITCLKMILEVLMPAIDYPGVMLAKVAQKHGVYVPNGHPDPRRNLDGLYHQPLIDYAKKFHLNGNTHAYAGNYEIADLIDRDRFVIASVHPSIREDRPEKNRIGGHLVLVNGYRIIDAQIAGFYIHNPSGYFMRSQANHFVTADNWHKVFSGRLISLHKNT